MKNSTALGAKEKTTHTITFKSKQHENFYQEYLPKCRYEDVYRKALVYCLGIDRDTREHINRIYDFKSGCVKTECLHEGWQTSGSVRIVRMAFNLYCDGKTSFLTWDYIRESHPRTAIGYYESGHYCLLCVDGRQPDYSRGMFPEEMAKLFEKLGCKAAYNLDGGHCTFMTMKDTVVNHPYKSEHKVPDGIFIKEALQ